MRKEHHIVNLAKLHGKNLRSRPGRRHFNGRSACDLRHRAAALPEAHILIAEFEHVVCRSRTLEGNQSRCRACRFDRSAVLQAGTLERSAVGSHDEVFERAAPVAVNGRIRAAIEKRAQFAAVEAGKEGSRRNAHAPLENREA